MKKVLVLLAVLALTGAVAPAATTLHVWTQLVTASSEVSEDTGDLVWTFQPIQAGTPVPLGVYGVQIWVQILGGSTGKGLESMAVTLYTPDTSGTFVPFPTFTGDNYTIWSGANLGEPLYGMDKKINGKVGGFNNIQLNPTYEPIDHNPPRGFVTDDSLQTSLGTTGRKSFGLTDPVLVATTLWEVTSYGIAELDVYIAPTSRYWNGSTKSSFDYLIGDGIIILGQEAVIPEPVTMTMVGMGLCGLGMFIRRRVKETV